MFEIEYKGANSVVIRTKKTTVITDPKLSLAGLKDVSTKDAVVLATEARFVVANDDTKLVIEGPGEYGFGEFDVVGVAAQRHLDTADTELLSTMYRVQVGDTKIAVIGNIYEKLSEEQLEQLGVIDIVVIPVGGNGYTLDATGAASVVRSIDPKVVIPVHYADPALSYEVPQDTLDTFVAELGAPTEETSKYKVKHTSSLPTTLTTVIVTRS